MHPSLTPEAQEEKRQAYERVPAWERQRVSKHSEYTRSPYGKSQRRAKERNRRQVNRQTRRRQRR